jgi:glutamyl-tRNA synthetase
MNKQIMEMIFQKITHGKDVNIKTMAQLEEMYPVRLDEAGEPVMVTRFAPSPTGFLHIGGVLTSLINKKIAHQNNGKFILRIEDTDTKREVEGATDIVVNGLKYFDLEADEGRTTAGINGEYGPYNQSQRADIYLSGVMHLMEQDLAYPCFCTAEELDKQREAQASLKQRPGYHTKWAKCSRLTDEEVIAKLEADTPFVIRFRANGDAEQKVTIKDLIKGKMSMPQNEDHIVIFKKDGLPTYHFAHAMDDHFMRTTHVIRADEWVPSLPLHTQLFITMGWKAPKYAHISPIQKMEEGSRRKLSKRKDPEANVEYYQENGYPMQAVIDYLMNLASASFEDWRKANPTASINEFNLEFSSMKTSAGALLDFDKLHNVSKNYIATLTAEQVFEHVSTWAQQYNAEFFAKLQENKDYITNIFGIERTGASNVRKDYTKWSDVEASIQFFFDEGFENSLDNVIANVPNIDADVIKQVIASYEANYDHNLTKEEWFNSLKEQAAEFKFAGNRKELKADPEAFIGDVSDFSKILRCVITGQPQSPDLYQIMQVMGLDRVKARFALVK